MLICLALEHASSIVITLVLSCTAVLYLLHLSSPSLPPSLIIDCMYLIVIVVVVSVLPGVVLHFQPVLICILLL